MSWMFYSLIVPLLLKMTHSDSTGMKTLTISNPNVDADYPCLPWYTSSTIIIMVVNARSGTSYLVYHNYHGSEC